MDHSVILLADVNKAAKGFACSFSLKNNRVMLGLRANNMPNHLIEIVF